MTELTLIRLFFSLIDKRNFRFRVREYDDCGFSNDFISNTDTSYKSMELSLETHSSYCCTILMIDNIDNILCLLENDIRIKIDDIKDFETMNDIELILKYGRDITDSSIEKLLSDYGVDVKSKDIVLGIQERLSRC